MAKDLQKILGESAGLSAEVQEQIHEAWETKLAETRNEVTAVLREEFAKKFEHDKKSLVESMDNFLTDKIRVELEEFAKDKKMLVKERVAYKRKISEHTAILDKFVLSQVAKEVKELRNDKVNMAENFKKLENFLLRQLSEEIQEFRTDKKALVEQKVKMVTEGKEHLLKTKNLFISRAAKVIEESINIALRKEISQFKDDIKVARENDFGRRIFESFVSEYLTSYLNEGTEVSKLNIELQQKVNEITSIKETVSKQQTVVEGLQSNLRVAKDRISRAKVLNGLLSPLSKVKKTVMNDLLESVQTKDLEKAYNKYLPAVLNESTPVRRQTKTRALNESKNLTEKTGNKARRGLNEDQVNDELAKLKILAGLK